jgi:hypothetical protein
LARLYLSKFSLCDKLLSLAVQGLMPSNVNLNDPAIQGQIFSLFSQMQAHGNSWVGASQGASQPNLENILAQISQRPEIAANLPSLLNSLAGGGYGQQQAKVDSSGLQDGGQGSYTAQLYGAPGGGWVTISDEVVNVLQLAGVVETQIGRCLCGCSHIITWNSSKS